MVYTSSGQLAVYNESSIALFESGYLTVLSEEAEGIRALMLTHLQELMEDADMFKLQRNLINL